MNKKQKIILGAAIAGAVSTFLPWISVSAGAFGYSVSQSRNGFHGAGVLFFILMAATAVLTFLGDQVPAVQKHSRLIHIGTGVLSLISLFVAYSDVQGGTNTGFGSVDVTMGIGLMLAFAAAIAIGLTPILIKQPGESLQADLAVLKGSAMSLQQNIQQAQARKATVAPTPAPPSKETDRMAELEKLITWRNDGKISQQEFDELKSKIIN